jgi:hypothetical protein
MIRGLPPGYAEWGPARQLLDLAQIGRVELRALGERLRAEQPRGLRAELATGAAAPKERKRADGKKG